MRKLELDAILSVMLQSYEGISDLNFSVGRPLQVEAFGRLETVEVEPPIGELTPYQTEQIALTIIQNNGRLLADLLQTGACDCSYALGDSARFRVNIFRQRGHFAIVMRVLQTEVPTIEALDLPEIFRTITKEKTGLVLVTGATGSGKTTTLAAVLEEINATQPVHIVTLEDPIEFVHPHNRATFNQRELGQDFDAFPHGLRSALRQAPKVILVGEMRDRETVEIALTAAETGHLVLSTLHTIDAGQTINRILGLFELEEEGLLRQRLSETVRFIISQRLVPRVDEGRHLICEIMGSNLRTREAIALGENETRTFYDIIEASSTFGWQTIDHSLLKAFEAGIISEETANLYATRKGRVVRAIDLFKKTRGYSSEAASGLNMDPSSRNG